MGKRNDLLQYVVHCYHIVMCKIMPILSNDEKAVRKYYKRQTGKYPDLNNPKTFSEKQQWYKLNDRDPLKTICADKYEVRTYITERGYGYLLNECYGVYDSAKDIPVDILPQQFVLKATHASGWNLIVRDKITVNWKLQRAIMKLWLKQDIYWCGREWVYKDQQKRIIAEKYLEDESGGLLDYKFFCFNGEPKFLQVEIGRYTDKDTRNFYDMDWNLLPFGKGMPHNPDVKVEKPELFEEMKQIAFDLSQDFSFVRVDLYQAQGRVYFGELTFFPAGGAANFVPKEYDVIVGNLWDISKTN